MAWEGRAEWRNCLSTICRWHTTSWAWCARSASTVPQSHLRPSSAPWPEELPVCLWKEVLMNYLCPLNYLSAPMSSVDSEGFPYEVQTWDTSHMQGMLTTSKTLDLHRGSDGGSDIHWTAMHAYHLNLLPSCIQDSSTCENDGGLDVCWTNACTSSQSSCISLRLQSRKNQHMYIISIFLHLTWALVTCENVSLADWLLSCWVWWSCYCHPRIWCKPVYSPSGYYLHLPIRSLNPSCMKP